MRLSTDVLRDLFNGHTWKPPDLNPPDNRQRPGTRHITPLTLGGIARPGRNVRSPEMPSLEMPSLEAPSLEAPSLEMGGGPELRRVVARPDIPARPPASRSGLSIRHPARPYRPGRTGDVPR